MAAMEPVLSISPFGRNLAEELDPLGAVQHERGVEAADLVEGHTSPAQHHGHGRQHALGRVLGVLGSEGQLVHARPDAQGVEQCVLGLPGAAYRVAGQSDGFGVDGHGNLPW